MKTLAIIAVALGLSACAAHKTSLPVGVGDQGKDKPCKQQGGFGCK